MRPSIALVGLVLALVCGCEDGADAAADAGLPPGITRSPDGVGYCCPMRPSDCPANLQNGGFIPTATTGCPSWSDARWTPSIRTEIDVHGCPYWVIDPSESCIVWRRDSGLGDGGRDAGFDAGQDASVPRDAEPDDAAATD